MLISLDVYWWHLVLLILLLLLLLLLLSLFINITINTFKTQPHCFQISPFTCDFFKYFIISLIFTVVLKHYNHQIIIIDKLGETGLKTGFDVINHLILNFFKHVDIIEIKQKQLSRRHKRLVSSIKQGNRNEEIIFFYCKLYIINHRCK